MNAGIAYPVAHLGIIGTDLLAIPVLAGSTAYAIGKTANGRSVFRASESEPVGRGGRPHFTAFRAIGC
jgi:hypothetical protein